MTVRTRFAPSPTGYLHIGGLRTALYNYLFAKARGGTFVLRVEDTDQSRSVDGAVDNMLRSLEWAGIVPDEGVLMQDGVQSEVGAYGPYTQSQRLERYRVQVRRLIESGDAYYCFCDAERLQAVRAAQQAAKQPPMYDGHCRGIASEEAEKRVREGASYVVRLAVPRGETIVIDDEVRGRITVETDTIDDQVLLKSDGFPTYHLASVVDDHEMRITHVIRGEEWLPSTPKHILLYRAFGWDAPRFAHVPLLLNPDRSKLSKRQGDVAVEDYKEKGFLPQALVNFVALLGWNPGKGETQEIFTMEELQERFSLHDVNASGAVCDLSRLRWFNMQHIKRMNPQQLVEAALPFLQTQEFFRVADERYTHSEYLYRVAAVVRERLETLAEFGVEQAAYFFARPEISDVNMLRWKKNTDEETRAALSHALTVLRAIPEDEWTREAIERELMEAAGEKRGDLLWPVRVALTGAKRSPSPFECAWVLGKEETLERIVQAIDTIA